MTDIARLPKWLLEDIANKMDIPNDNAVNLAINIYQKCTDNDVAWDLVQGTVDRYIFAGRCSVSWYPLTILDEETSLLNILCEHIGFNPILTINPRFEEIKDEEKVSSSPDIIGGVSLNDKQTAYLLRIVFKSGIKKIVSGFKPRQENTTSFVTVTINEKEKYIEMRGNDVTLKKAEQYFGSIFAGRIEPLERQEILAPFGNKIEALADCLGGKLIETVSIPDEVLTELNDEQAAAIGDILIGIDDYFLSGDITKVEETLKYSRECLSSETEDYLSVPFTAIVLAGMNRLGMTANDELRSQPLYSALQPYLQHQGGFLKFPLEENGVLNYYTVKVGLKTNTMYFVTPANEKLIEFVRGQVFNF